MIKLMIMSSVKKLFSLGVIVGLCAGVTGCREDKIPAPITDGWRQERAKDSLYTVQSDDTIYSIAWAFDLDYRHLAKVNHIASPYRLSPGQKLRVYYGEFVPVAPVKENLGNETFVHHQPEGEEEFAIAHAAKGVTPEAAGAFESSEELPITSRKPYATLNPKPNAHPRSGEADATAAHHGGPKAIQSRQYQAPQETTYRGEPGAPGFKQITNNPVPTAISAKGWQWPAQGKLIQAFASTNGGLKGIDIAGKQGSSVFATRAGKVVYSGNGLRGYGKLLIIKHNDEFLSAYAHNQSLLVHEGQTVLQGQEIATMGKTGAGSVKLHFEIRRAGKPIDPLIYLKV